MQQGKPSPTHFPLSPLFIDAFISAVTSSKIPMLSLVDDAAVLLRVHVWTAEKNMRFRGGTGWVSGRNERSRGWMLHVV